jgi:membrane protein required for colicin V production
VALVAAIGGIFVVTLIIVSIITVQVSDLILDSRIGALDRTLGLFFGAARGFLICVIGWAFLGWLLQGKEPEWAASSRTRPAMENTRDNIIAMLPENAEALLQRLRNKEAPTEAEPAEPDPQRPAAPGAPAAPQPPQRRS